MRKASNREDQRISSTGRKSDKRNVAMKKQVAAASMNVSRGKRRGSQEKVR